MLTLQEIYKATGNFDEDEDDMAPFILCSDVFFWGCADGESLLEEDIPEYEACLEAVEGDHHTAALLYCSRRRHMRPQGAYYTLIPKRFWYLFDAAGPERETGFGNPCAPGEYHPENQAQ
jgi:hypothetical protein